MDMIVNQLPDPRLFKSDSGGNLGNAVIYASTYAKYHYPDHVTPYLLVGNFKNAGNYTFNGRAAFVNDNFFYLLNAGDHLEINFKQKKPLETMLVLFSEQMIKAVAGYRSKTTDNLLDNYTETICRNFYMPDIPLAYNDAVIRCLNQLKVIENKTDLEPVLLELLDALWDLTEYGKSGLDQISAKRKSTREELYRRLFLAEQFMRDNYCQPLSIDEMASEACMNKFHFLKLFKHRYGVSPHQYLVRLKLEHAHSLLLSGKYSVSEACYEIGFESHGTFTHLFKRIYGFLPSKFPTLNK
jgi:AraC family transcriptional regulator